MYEYVIFGLPIGENRPYMEECIKDGIPSKETAILLAKGFNKKYHSIRIARFNALPENPLNDFKKAVNI